MGCFAKNLVAEFSAAMIAIEVAHEKGWRNFWLETDSKIVMLAFFFILHCSLAHKKQTV